MKPLPVSQVATLPEEASIINLELSLLMSDNQLDRLCWKLCDQTVYDTLEYQLQTGDLAVAFLDTLKHHLDDADNLMEKHPYELADARLQILRLYRAIDLHSWHFAPWILGVEGSPLRTLRVIGLCLTPYTVFH